MSNFFKSLDAASTNTTGLVFDVPVGGLYTLGAYGTWDGATVTFYISVNDDNGQPTNGFTSADGTFTADGGVNVELSQGTKIWAATTSVGTSSLTASVALKQI